MSRADAQSRIEKSSPPPGPSKQIVIHHVEYQRLHRLISTSPRHFHLDNSSRQFISTIHLDIFISTSSSHLHIPPSLETRIATSTTTT
jgi:hypothetical protein